MDDVFISYSRKDKAFATRLHEALKARQRDAWVDLEDIPPTAEWREKIRAGIEGARAFVFILSPDSMASTECRKEIDHAAASHKRLIPVVCREVDPQAAPEALGQLNWIFIREQDDFDKGIETLLTAVDTDLEWVDAHTSLLEKATEWDRKDRDKSLLLRGGELRWAEGWQVKSAEKEPKPTELMGAFIVSSRQGETRRQRKLLAGVSFAFVVVAIAAVVAFYQYLEADKRGKIALSRQLATQADNLSDSQIDLALLLGAEAAQVMPTLEARYFLVDVFKKYPQLYGFLQGHKSMVDRVAFSPDGKLLASASDVRVGEVIEPGKIILWDVKTRQPLGAPLPGDKFAFSPDGNLLALASSAVRDRNRKIIEPAKIILWDAKTRQLLEPPLPADQFAFGPHDKLLALASSAAYDSDNKIIEPAKIILWDIITRQPRGAPLTGHKGFVLSVAFSPDGNTLVSQGKNYIMLWDVETGQRRGTFLPGDKFIFSPEGKTLASWSKDRIFLWDVATGQRLAPPLIGHKGRVTSVAFSPDGKILASACSAVYDPDRYEVKVIEPGTIILWDVETGRPQGGPLTGHKAGVNSVSFSPDGKLLASASSTDYDETGKLIEPGKIILWDMAAGKPQSSPLPGGEFAFSPDSKTLIFWRGEDHTIRLWDVPTGRPRGAPLSGHQISVRSVAFSPDGKNLALGRDDATIILWDLEKQALGQLGSPLTGYNADIKVWCLAFSRDGKILASGSRDGTIILWDMEKKQALRPSLEGHKGRVASVSFTPDGKILASVGDDGNIILWDVDTGRPRGAPLTGDKFGEDSVAFSPDGKTLASGRDDATIILWDLEKRQALGHLGSPLTGPKNGVGSLAFSPDGKTLASVVVTEDVENIVLWDVEKRQPMGPPLMGRKMPEVRLDFTHLAFSPDGKILAVGGFKTIVLWDVEKRQTLGSPLTNYVYLVTSLAFSPDGKILASSGELVPKLWEPESGRNEPVIILWDVEKRQTLGPPLPIYMTSLTFSPDGKTLASGSSKAIFLWDVSLESWIKRACAMANRNLTPEEWWQYIGDLPYRETCPDPSGSEKEKETKSE